VKIANQTDSEVRRYGQLFPPKSELSVENSVIETYSAAESSLALQSIARSLDKLCRFFDSNSALDVNMQRSIKVSIQEPWQPEKISWFNRLKRKASQWL
jgi:hypothetical protein